jgi:hypothetical protein
LNDTDQGPAKEREAWCIILADRIVEERQQMLAIVEAEHRKVAELLKTERKRMINLLEAAHAPNKQLAAFFPPCKTGVSDGQAPPGTDRFYLALVVCGAKGPVP